MLMSLLSPRRTLAAVTLAAAVCAGTFAPAQAEETPASSSPPPAIVSAADDVPLPPQLEGYELAPDASGYSWGTREQDFIASCLGVPSPVGGHARVGQFYKDGRTPKVGDLFYARLDVSYTGSSCMPHTEIGVTEWVNPVGTDLYADDGDWQILGAIYSSTRDPQWSNGPWWISNPGPHGGTKIQNYDKATQKVVNWELRQGEVLTLFVPVRALRPLIGAGSARPWCTWRTQGDGPCPRTQAGDHLQVGVQTTHRFGDWYAPYVGLFASGSVSPTLSARAATTFSAGRAGAVTATVNAQGAAAAGTVTVRRGASVVGSARLSAAGRNSVRVPVRALPAGAQSLTVSYSGSSTVKGRSTTLRVNVAKARASVAAKAGRIRKGKGTVGATVRAPGLRPTGTVVVRAGRKVVGRAKVGGSGRVSVRVKGVPRGTRRLTVAYGGSSQVVGRTVTLKVRAS
ncbi:Ig-like domain-containing protein [Aeromicrobium sp. IC_218]|uniref:Ig-like domain-containing protein n=1 Tax=Aeromicrobium sp. IC_218 TaxID=2545468 RepID=UPI00103C30C5|nr:Ig-like domain-containing protein [Aeromicrobium sp. IC_218]TCI98730.1 Ig-like domain repeat protein [Aeromicrobium sp. IC_218]